MRKQELIDMIESRISGGDTPADVKSTIHGAIIEKHLEAIYNDLIQESYRAAVAMQDYSELDAYAKNHRGISVQDDTDRNLKYSELPFPPVRLPENLGIRMVYPEDDPTNPFAHVDNNSQAILSTLDVGSVDDVPSFWIEKYAGNEYRIYYDDPGTTSTVALLMILPLNQYDDFDDIPMPSGKDMMAIDLVVERLLNKPQEDTFNNNIPNR